MAGMTLIKRLEQAVDPTNQVVEVRGPAGSNEEHTNGAQLI